jgi:hypothetical protein
VNTTPGKALMMRYAGSNRPFPKTTSMS